MEEQQEEEPKIADEAKKLKADRAEDQLMKQVSSWEEQQKRLQQPKTLAINRPGGFLGSIMEANIRFLFRLPVYVFGPFPLYTMGLVSRQSFFLAGLSVLLLKITLLGGLVVYLHWMPRDHTARQHPWAYSVEEETQLDLLLGNMTDNWFTTSSNPGMFATQLGLTGLLALLTGAALTGRVPRRAMQRISKLAKFLNFVSLVFSVFHIIQLLLPIPLMSQLAKHKVAELQAADLFNTTGYNLDIYYKNLQLQAAGQTADSLEPPRPSFLDKVQFNERCCGLRSPDDWLEFSADELSAFGGFLEDTPGQAPPRFRSGPPASCRDIRTGQRYQSGCASAIGYRYLANRVELLPLAMAALLSLVSLYYLQRAYTAQDGLSGLEPEAIELAGDVASTSSLTGGSQASDRQINTTVPLVSVPTRIVRPVFEQCPKIGECTADVTHARLGYNEPLSFEERTVVTCSPQFFPLCFSPDAGPMVSLLQFCFRVIWGVMIYQVFVTNFARFYYKTSLGSGAYSRLLMVATLVAFVFPVVVSKRFLLVTLLFIPSMFLEFGGGYITSKIVEAVFSGPFQTLMHNLNQTQLSMQCFMLSGSDLAEAGLKLGLKPFVNIAHEYMTTTLLLSFLFKSLNSSGTELHSEYKGDNEDVLKDLTVTNDEMNEHVYKKLGTGPPTNPDEMSPGLKEAEKQAEEQLEKSEKEDEAEEAEAIREMNNRIAKGKATVKLARDKYNKFTSALSRAKQNASMKFRNKVKKICKILLFDIVNKCHKVGESMCKKFNEEVPWYMWLANRIFNIFDCPKIKHKWNKKACERLSPPSFVKNQCLKYAREAAPLPGTDGEFISAFGMIEMMIKFVTIDFGFTTFVHRFVPSFSIDDLIFQMAGAAFLLIEMSRIGILNQTWELINDMMIGAIIGEIFIFIKRFNTDLAFCNHYVTQQFIEIDYKRKQDVIDRVTNRSRDSLLPFAGWELREPVWVGEEHERELIAYPEQVGLTFGEREMIKRKYVADVGMLAIIGVIFLANYLVMQAVEAMNAGLPANLTFTGTSQLNVTVHGIDVNLAKRLTFGLVRDLTNTAVVNTTVELEDCKVSTKRMDDEEVHSVVTLVVLKLCMNMLYGYMSRLRPFMCALFYPDQQKRRTVALYNQLLRRRAKRQRFFRDQVLLRILAEKFNRNPLGLITRLRLRSPTWNSLFGSLPFMNGNVECLCCGDRGFEQYKICLECSGSYCRPCWYKLDSMCLLCILLYKRLVLDYETQREEIRKNLEGEEKAEPEEADSEFDGEEEKLPEDDEADESEVVEGEVDEAESEAGEAESEAGEAETDVAEGEPNDEDAVEAAARGSKVDATGRTSVTATTETPDAAAGKSEISNK